MLKKILSLTFSFFTVYSLFAGFTSSVTINGTDANGDCLANITLSLDGTAGPLHVSYLEGGSRDTTLLSSGVISGNQVSWDVSNPYNSITILVADRTGCISEEIISYGSQCPCDIELIPNVKAITAPSTCTSSDGAFSLRYDIGRGGTLPFSYEWGSSGINLNSSNDGYTGFSHGNYNLTVTDAVGCTAETIVNFSAQGSPEISNLVIDPACSGSSGSISYIAHGSNLTLSWQSGVTIDYLDNDGENGRTKISGLSAGTYCTTIQDDGSACDLVRCFTVPSESESGCGGQLALIPNCDINSMQKYSMKNKDMAFDVVMDNTRILKAGNQFSFCIDYKGKLSSGTLIAYNDHSRRVVSERTEIANLKEPLRLDMSSLADCKKESLNYGVKIGEQIQYFRLRSRCAEKDTERNTELREDNEVENFSVEMFPNPAKNSVNLIFNKTGNYKLSLLSIDGLVIWNKELYDSKEHTELLHELSSGVYILDVASGNDHLIKKLIIIE